MGFDFGDSNAAAASGPNLGLADGDDPFGQPNIGAPANATTSQFDTYTDPFAAMDDKYFAQGFASNATSEAPVQPANTNPLNASQNVNN